MNETNEERNIVELQDENGETEKFELLGEIEYENETYFIMTEYLEEEPVDNSDEPISTFVMKSVGEDETDIRLEPVLEEELGLAIFNKFFEELNLEDEI
jgi:hypothetical protein